jgi:hypothetical protein
MRRTRQKVFTFRVRFASISLIGLCILVGLVLFGPLRPNVKEVRSDEEFVACRDRLARIATAISQYYRATGNLPPACVRDDHGNPLLSGRVLLLPYLGAQDAYERLNLGEPWDSPQNLAALQSRRSLADLFHCQSDRGDRLDDSTYVLVSEYGIRLAKEDCECEPIDALPRDETNTVMMFEVAKWGVNWADPCDATLSGIRRMLKEHGLTSPHGVMVHVLLRDGRVLSLHTDYFEEIVERCIGKSAPDNQSGSAGDPPE